MREMYASRLTTPKAQSLDCQPDEVEFVCWTDAALANRVDMSSTGGFALGATSPAMRRGQRAKVNLVSWKAFKLKRIARSSLAAEIQAFSEGEEELFFCRIQWAEMLGLRLDPQHPEDVLREVRGILVTDAKSLYDVVEKGRVNTSGLGLSEKYSALELLSVLERLERGQTVTRWVDSKSQLADAMTKHTAQSSLRRVISDGVWTLVDEPLFISARRKSASLRRQE